MKKPSICKNCGIEFVKNKKTQKVCSYICALANAKKDTAKKTFVEIKEKNTDWRKKLQLKLQEIARIIDFGHHCLATQKTSNQYHGGHIFSRGGNSNMALNLHNIHRQSAHSNHFQAHDVLMRDGIVREYGGEYMEKLTKLKSFIMPKISNLEYKSLYKTACLECNKLKKNKLIRTAKDRISERNRINLCLGIYTDIF